MVDHDGRDSIMPSPIMEFFEYSHLPLYLQEVSGACADLAHEMEGNLPDDPEKSAGLRHLMEAKDCFVRARIRQLKNEGSEADRG